MDHLCPFQICSNKTVCVFFLRTFVLFCFQETEDCLLLVEL